MPAKRKRCNSCGRQRNVIYFYKRRQGSIDGYWGECKDCYNERTRAYKRGACESCGKDMYKANGYKLCRECRSPLSIVTNVLSEYAMCDKCTFLKVCKKRVMQTDQEHWDWMPPCYVSSKFHDAYRKEYHAAARKVTP